MPFSRFGLFGLVNTLFDIYYYLLIARILFPLLRLGTGTHPLVLGLRRVVYALTEPLLAPIRKVLAPIQLGQGAYLDLSPIIVLFLLNIVRRIVLGLLI